MPARIGAGRLALLGGASIALPTIPLGATATIFPIAPTVQFHAQTSNKVMRPNGTIQGYISGTTLTVTSHSQSTVRALVAGLKLITGATAGTTIVQPLYTGSPGNGGTGQYAVSISQTVGSAGSPATFTIQSDQINFLGDLKGVADLSADSTGNGPVLMQDGYGVSFLRFVGGYVQMRCWLRNLGYNLNGGTDSHNISWIMSARIHDFQNSTATWIGFGAKENTPVTNQSSFGSRLSNWYGQPTNSGAFSNANVNAATPGVNRMFLGSQLQIVGSAVAVDNGLNNATNATLAGRVGVNETSMTLVYNANSRAVNVPGFTLNSDSTKTQSESSNGGGGYFDLYELAGWLAGEFGTRAQMPARFDAAMAAMQANYSIPAVTDSLIVAGDSRSAYGNGQAGIYGAQDGSQTVISSLLGERGYSWSLPAGVRIVNMAAGGQGIGYLQSELDAKALALSFVPRLTAVDYMLGGGHDYIVFFMGSNDQGSGLAKYPSTTLNNGRTADNSIARGDDMFDGAAYTGSAVVSVAANGGALTTSGESGTLTIGSTPTTGTWGPGTALQTGVGTPYTLARASVAAHSSESTSYSFLTYKPVVQKLITRGFKVAMGPDTASGGTAPDTNADASGRFRARVLASMTDLDANVGGANYGKYRVFDLTQIKVGAAYPLGYQSWGNAAPPYYADNIHFSEGGRRVAVTGGDTPQNGYAAAVKALMGVS